MDKMIPALLLAALIPCHEVQLWREGCEIISIQKDIVHRMPLKICRPADQYKHGFIKTECKRLEAFSL